MDSMYGVNKDTVRMGAGLKKGEIVFNVREMEAMEWCRIRGWRTSAESIAKHTDLNEDEAMKFVEKAYVAGAINFPQTMIRTNVTIRDDQWRYLKQNPDINFSQWIRDRMDEDGMNGRGEPVRTLEEDSEPARVDECKAEPEMTLGELVTLHTKMNGVKLRFKKSDWKPLDLQDDEEYRKAKALLKELLDSLEVEDYPMTFNKQE
jgi:hypothetical protein